MGKEILVAEQIDAGESFIRDFNDYRPVSVACWVIPADSEDVADLYLYVASDDINDGNIDVAYREVLRQLNGKRTPWLDPFQVKLVNSSDRIARDAIQIRDRYSANLPTRYNGSSMGGVSIDGAYIYPQLSGMKSTS